MNVFLDFMKYLSDLYSATDVVVYGEWCGGNIQKGVAISALPRMFLIFGIKINQNENWFWLDNSKIQQLDNYEYISDLNSIGVHPITKFGIWNITIDFNSPKSVQSVIDDWVAEVDKQCPIGTYFGVVGHGEGIVFCNEDGSLRFKGKGLSHSINKSKSEHITKIDPEVYQNMIDFVEDVLTESRLNQGLDYLTEMELEIDIKNTGKYLSWIVNDIFKEESDAIVNNGFDAKKISRELSTYARNWFMKQINQRL